MGKSDIVASLKLNSSDYEKKLAQAKASTKKFSKDGGAGLADMVGKFKGLAVAVAGSKAAMEVFNRVVSSSQTIGDAYARTLETAKSVTDQFVYSIANADFTHFTDGLRGVRRRAQEAYDALDQLGNTKISYDYFNASERAAFREGILTAKDTSLGMAERRAGLAAAEAALGRLEDMTETLGANTTDYLRKEIAKLADLGASNVEIDALAKALAVDVSANAADIRQGIIAKYEEYQRRYAEEVTPYNQRFVQSNNLQRSSGMQMNVQYDPARALAAAEALNAEYAETKVVYTLLNRVSDEVLQKLAQQAMSVDRSKFAMGELVTQLREAARQLNAEVKPGTVGAVVSMPSQKVAGVGAATVSPLTEQIGGFAPVAVFAEGSYEAYVAAREGMLEYAEAMAATESAAMSASDSIYAISNAMGNLSGVVGENAASWMSWGANVLGAIGQFAAAMSAGGGIGLLTPAASILSSLAGVPSLGSGMNRGEIRLRVQGSDLVGSISNYNSIASRRY